MAVDILPRPLTEARDAGALAAQRDATASGQAFRGSIRAAREAGMAEGSAEFQAFIAGYLGALARD